MLALALVLAVHGWLVLVRSRRFAGSRALAVYAGVAAADWLYLVAVWAEGSRGSFWPAWPLLGLGFLGGLLTLVVSRPHRT